VKRFVCAHDCGLVINPGALRGTIAANLIQSLGRTMKEEVTFDRGRVSSVDWSTYPVTRSREVPSQIDIVLLNNPNTASTGAGEASSRPTAAAIANAIFDASGVRVRQVPLTASKIKAALSQVRPV
jgi:CO/xanthine dehydrogenase Mo-binding subunit